MSRYNNTQVLVTHDKDDYGDFIVLIYRGVKQQFRWCPPGGFLMGSPNSETDRSWNETQHRVTMQDGFWMAETPVTQAFWTIVMGGNPSRFIGEKRPVDSVCWYDAQDFTQRLNSINAGVELSLPTEAQWEYACRAGNEAPFCWGEKINTDKANFRSNFIATVNTCPRTYREKTVDADSLQRNRWGLFQMHGNVWEWCNDWFDELPDEHEVSPTGPASGIAKVLRGGAWNSEVRACRSAARQWDLPAYKTYSFGFRLTCQLRPE